MLPPTCIDCGELRESVPKATIDIAAFYAALDRRRQEAGLSWRALGRELDIPASTFTRLSNGGGPDVDAFAVLIHWLRLPVAVFLSPRPDDVEDDETHAAEEVVPTPPTPPAPATTVEAIASSLRQDANLSPEAIEAIDHLMRVAYQTLRFDRPHGAE